VRRPEVLGIQGKRKTIHKRITPGIGAASRLARLEYPAYTYEGVEPGFAEHDLDEYNAVADAMAWSRSLSTVRRGFGAEVDLERPWDDNHERTAVHPFPYHRTTTPANPSSQKNTAAKTPKSSSKHTSTTQPPS
jgi:hypothetical protein